MASAECLLLALPGNLLRRNLVRSYTALTGSLTDTALPSSTIVRPSADNVHVSV
jgi:hypothetical protein